MSDTSKTAKIRKNDITEQQMLRSQTVKTCCFTTFKVTYNVTDQLCVKSVIIINTHTAVFITRRRIVFGWLH